MKTRERITAMLLVLVLVFSMAGYAPAVAAGATDGPTAQEPEAFVEALIKEAPCVVSSETANTQEDVTTWLKTWVKNITGLNDALGLAYDISVDDLSFEPANSPEKDTPAFTAAVDGTADKPEGQDGRYDFLITATRGGGVLTRLQSRERPAPSRRSPTPSPRPSR